LEFSPLGGVAISPPPAVIAPSGYGSAGILFDVALLPRHAGLDSWRPWVRNRS
jgi:hypothetical protein